MRGACHGRRAALRQDTIPGNGRLQAALFCMILAIGITIWIPGWASASAEMPVVRISLEPPGPVEPGTDLDLRVEVLVPTWFLDAPRFPESFDLPGTTVELQRGSAESFSESIAGSTWAGLRRHYRIQPLNPGEFQLPELAIAIRYARADDRRPLDLTVHGQLSSPVRVTIPPAAALLDPFIAAHRLRLVQRIERPEGALGVGDAIRRTIVLETDAAMAELPTDAWIRNPGMQLYLDPPRSHETRSDAAARALLRQERSATWVFEQPGVYELPALSIRWWDLAARQVRQADLPALPLTVGLAHRQTVFGLPEAMAELAPVGEALRQLMYPIALGLGASALLWLGWNRRRLGRGPSGRIRAWRQAALASERWLFARLILACRRDDGPAARNALQHWLDARAGCPPTLNGWLLEKAPSTTLAAALAELDATLYGPVANPDWRGAALSRQLLLARRRLRRQHRAKTATLPLTLNP